MTASHWSLRWLVPLVAITVCGVACTETKTPARSTPTASTQPTDSPPTPAPTPTTVRGQVAYVVQPGDTLLEVAKNFGVSPQAIISANQLVNQDSIVAGQTLQIPPPPVVHLTVTPDHASGGNAFHFAVDGAQPSESVTFQIVAPEGKSFTGPAHVASANGDVSATYQTSQSDPPGAYTVTAKGDQNTTVTARFTVDPPASTSTGN